MNADGIFLVDRGVLKPLMATPYENEDLLQQALVNFPEVLAGRVTDADDQRALLLVKREKGVPITEEGAAHFSIDHFFVDIDAVPVLVEVKRQSDTRIRREVVGQMLDYAANAVRYWPIDEIRADFEESFDGENPDAFIDEFSDVGDADAFWSQVERNLRDGRIRMLFVADGFPDELIRVIEFLNEQMTPAEVLGIEVRQYTDGKHQVLVPRVIGATSTAERTKRTSGGKKWNRTTFLESAAPMCSGKELELLERLLDFAEESSSHLSWGVGRTPRVSVWHAVDGDSRYVWILDAPRDASVGSKVSIWRKDLIAAHGPDRLRALLEALGEIHAFAGPLATEAAEPAALLRDLGQNGVDQFTSAMSAFLNGAPA